MQLPKDAVLLRIFIGENDRFQHRALYEAIVLKAREMHIAGATVLRGPMGYGHSSRLHTAKILRLSEDLPLVIEIVDSEDKINPELAIVSGPLSLQGEYSLALLDAPQLGNPSLCGFYVFASYLLTGETRRYDPAEGVFVGVQPKRNFDWGKGG